MQLLVGIPLIMRANILVEEPHIKSQAALVLLHKQLIRGVKYHGYKGWLRFRLETLERWQAERGSLHCHYCGLGPLVIDTDNRDPMVATLDHRIPRAKGGAEFDLNNLVVACSPCNQKKGDKTC